MNSNEVKLLNALSESVDAEIKLGDIIQEGRAMNEKEQKLFNSLSQAVNARIKLGDSIQAQLESGGSSNVTHIIAKGRNADLEEVGIPPMIIKELSWRPQFVTPEWVRNQWTKPGEITVSVYTPEEGAPFGEVGVVGGVYYSVLEFPPLSSMTQISDPRNPLDTRVWQAADGFPAKIFHQVQAFPNGLPENAEFEAYDDGGYWELGERWDGTYILEFSFPPIEGEPFYGENDWWEQMLNA